MRQDPVIFPALETGKIGFSQANELLAAPAVARRTLLDKVLRNRTPKETIRTWVREVKRDIRHSQQTAVAAMAADNGKAEAGGGSDFANLVAQLRSLGQPRTPADREALEELLALATSLLEPERRRRARRTG